jgi:hypothetical protein
VTARQDQLAAAREQVCDTFFALAADPDSPVVDGQADAALAALDEMLAGTAAVTG